MKVAQVLRKYVPEEWGGTEKAVKRLLDGFGRDVESVVFAPTLHGETFDDPGPLGHPVRRYRATLPVIGIPKERRRQLESTGANLLSLQLLAKLSREPGVSVVHTHALNQIGGVALTVARRRGVPFVVTVHDGAMDLTGLDGPVDTGGGIEWGKAVGALLGARRVLEDADAILTSSPRQARALRKRYPGGRVVQTFAGVDVDRFAEDHGDQCPGLGEGKVVLVLGRVDPVENQLWLARQFDQVRERYPGAQLVLAGSIDDEAYGRQLQEAAGDSLRMLGGLPEDGAESIALLRRADVVVAPSKLKPFSRVAVHAWASGTPLLAPETPGAPSMIRDGKDGLLFDLEDAASFHRTFDRALGDGGLLVARGRVRAREFGLEAAAAPVLALYEELIEARQQAGAA